MDWKCWNKQKTGKTINNISKENVQLRVIDINFIKRLTCYVSKISQRKCRFIFSEPFKMYTTHWMKNLFSIGTISVNSKLRQCLHTGILLKKIFTFLKPMIVYSKVKKNDFFSYSHSTSLKRSPIITTC